MIRVTIEQLDREGNVDPDMTETVEIEDDYLLICEGRCEQLGIQLDRSGSRENVHTITVTTPKPTTDRSTP